MLVDLALVLGEHRCSAMLWLAKGGSSRQRASLQEPCRQVATGFEA